VSLVHKLVDEEFAERTLRPLVQRPGLEGSAPEPDWRAVKSWCLQQLAWGGLPQIELIEADAEGRGELVFVHHHDGRDLSFGRAQASLLNLAALWGRPVQLLTILEKQGKRLTAKGGEVSVVDTTEAEARCATGEDGPKPPSRREAG
jgi:spore cortex formation protein SpoVR/YcgB (stage V sporulation)